MNKYYLLLPALVFSLLFSCKTDKRLNTEAVQKEIQSREAKKITEAEILSKAQELGNQIALSTKQTLGKNLKDALQLGGVENAINFCNLNASPIVDSLNTNFNVAIRRVTSKSRNPNNLPSEIEKSVLEAYEFQKNKDAELKENIQVLEGDQYLFTKPIMIDNAICLTCHGTFENGLSPENNNFIKSKYPLDKATEYQLGDFRGMWSITIPKKTIVQTF